MYFLCGQTIVGFSYLSIWIDSKSKGERRGLVVSTEDCQPIQGSRDQILVFLFLLFVSKPVEKKRSSQEKT